MSLTTITVSVSVKSIIIRHDISRTFTRVWLRVV